MVAVRNSIFQNRVTIFLTRKREGITRLFFGYVLAIGPDGRAAFKPNASFRFSQFQFTMLWRSKFDHTRSGSHGTLAPPGPE